MKMLPCWALIALFSAMLISCRCKSPAPSLSVVEGHVVEVTAKDFTFEIEDEILSGWTTFRLKNAGMMHHFFLLNRLPDGITFDDYFQNVTVPFDEVWDALRTGEKDRAEALEMLHPFLLYPGSSPKAKAAMTSYQTTKVLPSRTMRSFSG